MSFLETERNVIFYWPFVQPTTVNPRLHLGEGGRGKKVGVGRPNRRPFLPYRKEIRDLFYELVASKVVEWLNFSLFPFLKLVFSGCGTREISRDVGKPRTRYWRSGEFARGSQKWTERSHQGPQEFEGWLGNIWYQEQALIKLIFFGKRACWNF